MQLTQTKHSNVCFFFVIILDDFTATYKLSLSRYQNNGKNHFKIEKSKFTFDTSGYLSMISC